MARPLPTHDLLGRPQQDPHRLFSHIGGINQIAEWARPVRVPDAFWQLDADDAGEKVAVVACACGSEHIVALLECPSDDGGCERSFAFTGVDVWVFNSPKREHPADEDADDVTQDATPA